MHFTKFKNKTEVRRLSLTSTFTLCLSFVKKSLSSSFVFMDIVTGFAVLLRRIVFVENDDDEMWLRKLKATGFSDADIFAILEVIRDNSWCNFDGNYSDEFLFKLTSNFYQHTWFSQEAIPNVSYTTLGSLAGTPPLTLNLL